MKMILLSLTALSKPALHRIAVHQQRMQFVLFPLLIRLEAPLSDEKGLLVLCGMGPLVVAVQKSLDFAL